MIRRRREPRVVRPSRPLGVLAHCFPRNDALLRLARQIGRTFYTAMWDEDGRVWMQVISVPMERAREPISQWFGEHAIHNDDAQEVLIVSPANDRRPVFVTAAIIRANDFDAAQDAAETHMLATLRIFAMAQDEEMAS
jgi:hypothetical protein